MNKSSAGVSPETDASERYKFTVSYDGTLYWGFQRQGIAKTIQAELETALKTLGWEEASIIAAGRTDSGVHAEGQVFSAALHWKHGLAAMKAALNARLPEDIAILAVEPVPDDFHARYSAKSRTYRYHLYHSEVRNPLKDRFSWQVWPEVELEKLNEAAAVLIGEHDFRAFGSPPRKNGRTDRTVFKSGWFSEENGEKTFEVEANGFLYHMVRRMVYLQIQTARGKLGWQDWENTVAKASDAPPGLAPPNGLSLYKVRY